MGRRAKPLLALLFAAFAALCSRFWDDTRDLLAHRGEDYATLRTERSFDRTPVLPIAARLDEILPSDVPVALSRSLAENDGLRQRLTEALYPRRVDATSPHVLALSNTGEVRSPAPDPSLPVPAIRPPRERFDFDDVGLVLSLGALFGFGFTIARLLGLSDRGMPAGVLAGAAFAGTLVYLASFVQVPIPWTFYRAAGWALLVLGAVREWRHRTPKRISFRNPEGFILLALVVVLCFRVVDLPITGWDGRSVWLFHAKQIYFQQMMAISDLHHPDWEWSHPVYPFLVPGLMATFGGGGGVFNERMAALAAPILWGSSLGLLWMLLREHTGRVAAAAIAVTLFFGMQHSVGELYMDALVAVLLAIVVLSAVGSSQLAVGSHELAVGSRQFAVGSSQLAVGSRRLALLAAFVVSLVKVEGAIAVAILLPGWAAFELWRGRRSWATATLLIPLALPVAHRAWLAAHHVTEFQASLSLDKTIASVPTRLPVIASGLPGMLVRDTSGQQLEIQALLRLSVVGLLCGLALWLIWKERTPGKTLTLATGLMLIVLAVGATSGMPQDAAWLVSWTLDRLLLHPAVMFLLFPFL